MLRIEILEQAGLGAAAISGLSDGDCSSRPEAVASRNAFLACCDILPTRLARVRQVHGTIVHVVGEAFLDEFAQHGPEDWPAGDGLITDLPRIALAVSVADCVPLWIFDPVCRALGLFHAGRAGTVAGMATAGVNAMVEQYGCRPGDMLCVIGPSAGPCCYEVSPDMAEALQDRGFPVVGRKLDLWEANRSQLMEAGVYDERIYVTGNCTLCGSGFHSYRKSGAFMRNLAVGMI